jgi:surface carbohydrate biosynthesis protein
LNKTEITQRRWLLVPVETKARELTAKTLFACVAAERGWGAIVGEKKTVRGRQNKLPRGTFIEKSISPGRISDIEKAMNTGHRVSAWCEEGLIYMNRDEYSQKRLEPQSFNAIDYFFAWGQQQADDVAAILGPNKKTILTGNPRFDLLRPEMRSIFVQSAEEIRNRFGKIILINTKFSDVNNNRNIPGFDYVSFLQNAGKIRTKELELHMRRYIAFNQKIFSYFQKLLPVLSQTFRDHVIIVRPHPSESHLPWIELSRNLPNVQVIFEGNVNEWLLASDIMIHNNCTTGVEAFLLERPAISYRPIQDEAVEHELPNKVSFEAFSEEELFVLVRRFIGNGNSVLREERDMQETFARKYIANMEGTLSCETILDYLDRLDLPFSAGMFPLNKDYLKLLEEKAEKLKSNIKNTLRNKNDLSHYYKQKFPGITMGEMTTLLDELRKASGRFSEVQIIPVDDNTFCFYQQ